MKTQVPSSILKGCLSFSAIKDRILEIIKNRLDCYTKRSMFGSRSRSLILLLLFNREHVSQDMEETVDHVRGIDRSLS